MTLAVAFLMVISSCASKKDLVNCQNENRELTNNYLTAKEHITGKKAYSIIENAAVTYTSDTGKKLAKLMRIPGMTSLFISLWEPISRKMFGENNGFQNVFYPKECRETRKDIDRKLRILLRRW